MAATNQRTRMRIAGSARVIGEVPVTDGSTANEIHNYRLDETGVLQSAFRTMTLTPPEWSSDHLAPKPMAYGIIGICSAVFHANTPELLLLTLPSVDGDVGSVWRYTPWTRDDGSEYAGWTEQLSWDSGSALSVDCPQKRNVPACMSQVGNSIWFAFGDGNGIFVWDGQRVRRAGFSNTPAPPMTFGPSRGSDTPNSGGFSVRGRIGTTESSWTNMDGVVCGGLDDGEWRYGLIYEGPTGAWSQRSSDSDSVTLRVELATIATDDVAFLPGHPATYPENLTRAFRVLVPEAPPNVSAQILVRTPNLKRLNPTDTGTMRFLHRIPHSGPVDYVDDIPDGELGAPVADRISIPAAYFFLLHGGSMFYLRSDGEPAGMWWSEQSPSGSFYESCLLGHFRQVYPRTGAITAARSVRIMRQETPIMLVWKASALHYVAGSYPTWVPGIIHEAAGCDGWNLVCICPDGTIVWYGNNTFWRMDIEGKVDDIGGPIRRRIRRINRNRSHMGTSEIDPTYAVVVFALPIDDADNNNYQFHWDWRLQGWRTAQDMSSILSLHLAWGRLLTCGGAYPLANLYVFGRALPTCEQPTSIYTTGWISPSNQDESVAAKYNSHQVMWLMVDGSYPTADMSVYTDWNDTDAVTSVPIKLATPEDDKLSFLGPSDGDTAVYGTDVWRIPRTFEQPVAPVEVDSYSVICVSLSSANIHSIVAIEVHQNAVAGPGERGRRAPDADLGDP